MNRFVLFISCLFVCLTGRAHVRIGLDLFLRDDQTGEWLIGLFDEYAVYDCDNWEYLKADAIQGNYLVTNGREQFQLELRLQDNIIKINNVLHHVSEVKDLTLPDYPVEDESDFYDNGYSGGKVILKGRITNIPPNHEDRLLLRIPSPLGGMMNSEVLVSLDSLGRFSQTVELADTGEASLLWAKLVLTPGNTYYVSMDGATGKTLVMGKDARLSNELIMHDMPGFMVRWQDFENKTDATILEAAENDLKRAEAKWGNTEKLSPMLSKRYRQLSRWQWKICAAFSLVQRRFNDPAIRQSYDGTLWQWLKERIFEDQPRPYTLVQDHLAYALNNYVAEQLDPILQGSRNYRFSEYLIDLLEEFHYTGRQKLPQAYLDSLVTFRRALNDYRDMVENGMPDSLLTRHPYMDMVGEMFAEGTPLMQLAKSPDPYECLLTKNIHRYDTLDISDDFKDLSKAIAICEQLDKAHTPMSEALSKLLDEHVGNPYYKEIIRRQSRHFAALAEKQDCAQSSLMANEPLAGIADGKEVLDRILTPFKGRFVLLDFWGSWCLSCRNHFQIYTKPLLRALQDLPVTYVYLCNNTNDNAWRSVINEYELTGNHSVHYNLPVSQETSVERFLGVTHYPTYILFDQWGNRLPENVHPSNPAEIRRIIENSAK